MNVDNPTMASAAAAAATSQPWQVRWKRPQWERVHVGISEPEHDSTVDNGSYSLIASQDNNLLSNDVENDLEQSWVPISSSSITLDRREAHAAIMELQRRGKLLIRRTKHIPDEGDITGANLLTPLVDNVKTVTPSRPPRGGGKGGGEELKSSSVSPSNFMTPPRKGARKRNGEDDNNRIITNDGDDHHNVFSPPYNTDASTASSLLWEDRTLTSVSEQDAAAFRMYEKKGKICTKQTDHDTSSHLAGNDYLDRLDSNEDWDDGFDHVILLVTVFATASEQSKRNLPTGDVVVLELVSTHDPPLPTDHKNVVAEDVTTTSRSKQQQQQQQQRHSSQLRCSSSSSSSLTTPSPTSISQRSIGGGSVSLSYDTTQSKTDNIQPSVEEVETPSNHSRLLARRVLRWPSSVVSRISTNSNKCDGCPAFVVLGRTTVLDYETNNNNNDSQTQQIKVKLKPKTGGEVIKSNRMDNKKNFASSNARRLDDEEMYADAMDAIRSLDFLFEMNRSNVITSGDTVTSHDTESYGVGGDKTKDFSKTKKKQPLSLCFVTNDGYAHFFHAMRLFLSHRTNRSQSSGSGFSNSFATFVMGSELFTKLRQDVAPLSRPIASVVLSQVTGYKEAGDNTSIWKDIVSSDPVSIKEWRRETEYDEKKEDTTKSNWANLTSFEASIDPATVRLRTLRRSNILTGSCFTSDTNNIYLAVCGKGLRHHFVRGKKTHSLGGFVTFVSIRHHAESKTIYLPFAPSNIHSVYWQGKDFVIISGEKGVFEDNQSGGLNRRPCAVAVRVDSTRSGFVCWESLHVKRFRPVPIKLPSISESLGRFAYALPREEASLSAVVIGVSSIPSSPPGIILSYQCLSAQESHNTFTVVVNHTLELPNKNADVGSVLAFHANVRLGHRVIIEDRIDFETSSNKATEVKSVGRNTMWCTGGQGWTLLGRPNARSYFVCWDGSSETVGPFVLQFGSIKAASCLVAGVTPLLGRCALIQYYDGAASFFNKPQSPPASRKEEKDDFLPKLSCSLTIKESIKLTAAIEGGIDDILVKALDSISNEHERVSRRSKMLKLSHNEKSRRMLRHCSSWTQLQNRGTVYGQVLFAFIRFGTRLQSLSLRSNAIYNPLSTPFNEVLSWLCQRRDYFTAACVALSCLDDADAVYDLRGVSKTDIGEQSIHKSLIDGITPLGTTSCFHDTMTSLADMAVGCLIKGGAEMSSALEGFLLRNKLYDASDACLMLVGTAMMAISQQDVSMDQKLIGQNIVTLLSSVERPKLETVWPVRCLLKMAVVRNRLRSAMLMLNVSIPNELRWRSPKSTGVASTKRPSLGLFLALIDIILESSPEATRVLLDLLDEESGMPFWFSIEEDTRLALSLVSVHGKYVMLQEPEVRAWALERLKKEIEFPSEYNYRHIHLVLPDEWLREVVSGTFCNAETEIGMGLDSPSVYSKSCNEGSCYREEMRCIKDMLIPKHRSGLDFDLLIAALLILTQRRKEWREMIPTQILLNAVCKLGGKKFESKFVFDSATVLQQCALTENLQAAAFLVGGKNGLVLECVDLITSKMDIEINDAETALFAASVNEFRDMMCSFRQGLEHGEDSHFTPNDGQYHLLWLLKEHVLSVVKYGDLDAHQSLNTKRLDPVFVGRLCFRVWYSFTHPAALYDSAKWLESFLRRTLELSDGTSPKRLACAALVRVLLWVDEAGELDLSDSGEDSILATLLGFDGRFMAELARACCGLIESIPPHLADEVMCGMNHFSFESCGSLSNESKL